MTDRLFEIFCSRSLRQYRINYKFHVSVRLLTIKISQWAREDSAVIVKNNFLTLYTEWFSKHFFIAWQCTPRKQVLKKEQCLLCSHGNVKITKAWKKFVITIKISKGKKEEEIKERGSGASQHVIIACCH